MTKKIKQDVRASLRDGDLNGAVESLKTGLRRDPYWEWGHRKLGDLYLEGLGHSSYALVEYRKLKKSVEELSDEDVLRLALAYRERGFEDKVRDVLANRNPEDFSGTLEIMDRKYDPEDLYEELMEASGSAVEEDAERYREKYAREGDDHLEYGNFFEAQKAYEKALDFGDDPQVRLNLARALIQRSRYPGALEQLRAIRDEQPVRAEASELITKVYERLGLNQLFDDSHDDDDHSGRNRKVS